MQTDALPSAKSIIRPMPSDIDPIEGFDVLAYQKGQAIVAMTESWIGEDEFQNAIVDYIQKYAWKNEKNRRVIKHSNN